MAVRTIIGIRHSDGSLRKFDGELLTKAQAELVEKNIANNASYVLSDSSISKEGDYRLVMIATLDNIRYHFEFDTVKDVDVDITSELTEHPLVTGDIIGDHMYRKPADMSVSGRFSLQGNQRFQYTGAGERLSNIQDIFERINKEGVLSTLMTIKGSVETGSRFKVREHMALTSIHWKEHINSLEFQFGFNEVLQADVQTIEVEEDVIDPNSPAITDAMSADFTDTMLDWTQIDTIIIKQLISIEAVTADFLQFACESAKNTLAAVTIGVAAGVATAALIGLDALGSVLIVCGSVPVYGWMVAAGVAVVAAIVAGFVALFKEIKLQKERAKFKVKQFKLYNDDRKNQQEVIEFANYIGSIHQNLETLEDVCQVYSINSNTNQECMVYIDDKYYIFRFMKNNTAATPTWSLTVYDNDNDVVAEVADINGFALSGINECTHNNCVFRTAGSGFYIYLINKKYEELKNNNATDEDLKKAAEDLTNYYVFVAQTDMEKFNSMLADIVINAMTM